MKPAVLISIRAKHCRSIQTVIENIDGKPIYKKTIDVRKTRPKIETPFKCYIYQTFGKLHDSFARQIQRLFNCGKVIGEFVCDRIDIYPKGKAHGVELAKSACLEPFELTEYSDNYKKDIYAWHISDLKIYDEPKELGEFFRLVKCNVDGPICGTEKEMQDIIEWDCETVFNKESTACTLKDCPKLQELYRITRAPQSWCYVEELKE